MSHGRRRSVNKTRGAPHDESENPYFAAVGLEPKPPTSRASLLKEADQEERRSAAARTGAEKESKRSAEKLLQMKSQRAQVGAKLSEWEDTFRKTHARAPTDADRQRSNQHQELSKLCADLDRFISAAETGTAPNLPVADVADEKKAQRWVA